MVHASSSLIFFVVDEKKKYRHRIVSMIGQGRHYQDTSSKYHPQTYIHKIIRMIQIVKKDHIYVLYIRRQKVTMITEENLCSRLTVTIIDIYISYLLSNKSL